jgi:hypothetical protein
VQTPSDSSQHGCLGASPKQAPADAGEDESIVGDMRGFVEDRQDLGVDQMLERTQVRSARE